MASLLVVTTVEGDSAVRVDWVYVRSCFDSWRLHFINYAIRCGDAISQFLNVLIFFSKNPNESISGRSYRERRKWFWCKMMGLLDWVFSPFQSEHCRKSHEADLTRAADTLKSAE